MGGCSEESVAPAWCRVGQRGPDGAGHAVNPPPGSGSAAGGCAFGRLRGMPRKQAPSPLGARPRLARVRVLRTRQDRRWASCPTRPRHASGPCRGRSCPARPPLPAHHPAGAVGWLFKDKGRSSADQRSAPTKAEDTTAAARCFRSHEPLLLTPLSGGPAAPAGNRQGGGQGTAQDRWRHGWRHRAPRDGFTACPAQSPVPLQSDSNDVPTTTPR